MVYEIIQSIAAVAIAVGIIIAMKQLIYSKKNAIASFEDGLDHEYRQIINRIPIKAILGEELSKREFNGTLDDFFSYIDLSNEEVFLRQRGRISRKTWIYWRDGIKDNLKKPAFKRAWEHIKSSDLKIFSELKKLEKSGFNDDPKKWK